MATLYQHLPMPTFITTNTSNDVIFNLPLIQQIFYVNW